jgi:hypothetical protein
VRSGPGSTSLGRQLDCAVSFEWSAGILVLEELTRAPVTPKLRLPGPRRHYDGLAVSLVLHALLLGLLIAHGERLWSATKTAGALGISGGSASGGGGNRVAYITLPSPPAVASIRPPRMTPPVTPPRVEPTKADPVEPKPTTPESAETAVVAALNPVQNQSSSGTGNGAGGGVGDSVGRGQGSGTGEGNGKGPGTGGEGGKLRPPEPRDMAFPFDKPPKELRGVSLNVTFWVRVDGAVERYVVDPEIKDRDYAKKFDEVMRAFRFTPARAPDGTRVAGTTRISFTLPGKSSS